MASSPEAYLVSAVVRNRDYTTAVTHGAKPELFHAYQEEWEWIERFFSKYRKTPSKMAFKRKFPDFPLKAVDDTQHFTDEVRKSHARYLLTSSMRDTADAIGDGDIDKAVKLIQASVIEIASDIGGIREYDILSNWEHAYDDVAARKKRFDELGMAGIPTGFDTFDNKTGGIQPGQSVIVGARLGEGKTWTLMRVASAAIMNGYNVHFAALEMSSTEVSMRMHNFLSGAVGKEIFQAINLSQGKDFDLPAYREFLRGLRGQIKGNLTVSDSKKLGEVEIAAQIERHKPDLYILDYLTLAKMRGDGGWQDIGQFSKALKNMAGEYGVGMLSAAQLNREAASNQRAMPGAETLGQSDQIGQDADMVITLRKRSDRVTEYHLAKNRHGQAGFGWWAQMEMKKGVFAEVSFNKAQELIHEDQDAIADAKENS